MRRQLPPQPNESPCNPPETAPPRFEFRFFCAVFRSESKAPKTPPSHDLTGLAAINPIANSGPPRGLQALSNRTAKPKPGCANGSEQTAAAAALWISHLALRFQERIQGPKNAPIARFDGIWCYQTGSEKSVFRPAARRSAFQRLRRSANASPCSQIAAAKQRRSVCRGGAALKFAPGALFSGANPSPKKRPHRTVSGALLLSTR